MKLLFGKKCILTKFCIGRNENKEIEKRWETVYNERRKKRQGAQYVHLNVSLESL